MKSPQTINDNKFYRVQYREDYTAKMIGYALKQILAAGNKTGIWWFDEIK